ncbi:MAG: heavy metal translocating P-type ATPase [Clostridia bacterium]|nr:heavy metal translocating P-type ATPase [Clostridia bacterium]
MTNTQKRLLGRILIAALLFCLALAFNLLVKPAWYWGLVAMLIPYLTVGYDVLWEALCNIAKGKVFDENFLMAVASLGALVLCVVEQSAHEAHEAAVIMLFYQVGELFQSVAVGKSRKSLSTLLSMMPEYANVERDGKTLQVDPAEVCVGETILIFEGERVPLDGVILEGSSSLNTASLTGESLPKDVTTGDEILSGCINGGGLLRVRVSKPFEESTVSKIMELVENAGMHKSKSERFISSFARKYTPIVTFAALAVALLPPVFLGIVTGDWHFDTTWYPFVHAALMFLIVSCPCALVISVPMSFFGGIGGASAKGILIKGSGYLEALSSCKTVCFDKTGTLTKGDFTVSAVCPAKDIQKEELLLLAASAEQYSTHPLALAVLQANSAPLLPVQEPTALPGKGVRVRLHADTIFVGNRLLMEEQGIDPEVLENGAGSALYVAKNDRYLGALFVSDTVKEDSAQAIKDLRAMGISTVMLTGDRRENAQRTATELGIDRYEAALLPEGKVNAVKELLSEKKQGETVAFAGDGINDAPVLALCDVGIAMGALGSDAAIEAADVVLMNDRPGDLVSALRISKKTMGIVRQNIVLAIGVKVAVMLLLLLMSVIPALSMLTAFAGTFAVFADVGVSVLAILNAMRAMKI